MFCPICHNLTSTGRCPHDLAERTQAANRNGRIESDHLAGRIDITTRINMHNKTRRYQNEQ